MRGSNSLYALVGLGMTLMGLMAFFFGIVSLLGVLAISLLGNLIPGAFISLFQALGIGALIGGAISAWLGLYLVNKYGGKLFKLALGLVALLTAIISAFLAIVTATPTGFIGLFVFLISMVFFLIVADWGMETEFFTKFIKAIPVVGKATVGVMKFALPRKR